MQVHEITKQTPVTEGWMDTARTAVSQGAKAAANAAGSGMGSHFIAGLTGQDPQNISAMFSTRPNAAKQYAAQANQKPEPPADALTRVQKDPQLQQLVAKLESDWRKYAQANQEAFKTDPAKDNDSLSEAVDSGYQPLPGSTSGIVVPAGMTRPAPAPRAPAPAPVANTNQQTEWYKTRFVDWARSRLKTSDFDPTANNSPNKAALDKAASQLADAALKNNSTGITTAFKEYMNLAIAAVQLHTAQVANRTDLVKNGSNPLQSPTPASNNPADAANTPDIKALLQKANVAPQQLVALGRVVGIPTGQQVKNTGNEQLNNIIRAMGIRVQS
jgi:hypothetical protein